MTDNPARPAPLESITVGDIKITYLPDGHGVGTAHVLFPAGDEAFWASHPDMLDEKGRLLVTFGGFLIESGGQTVSTPASATSPFPSPISMVTSRAGSSSTA